MSRVLILSDGRMGHLNQSLAFVKYLDLSYDVVPIKFKYKWLKVLSYILDKIGVYTEKLFDIQLDNKYDVDISSYVNEKLEHVGV